MNWWQALLAGGAVGLIVVTPITCFIIRRYKTIKERMMIKKEIKLGHFLIPIDADDFDSRAWSTDAGYGGVIKVDPEEKFKLNKKIFKNNCPAITSPVIPKKTIQNQGLGGTQNG